MANLESRQDLYEFEKGRFKELLAEDKKYAYKRYGLTLLYSLEPEETLQFRSDLGWNEKDPLDLYNLGTVEAENENYKEAMQFFQQAEAAGCDQPELFYNIGAVYENDGENGRAIEYYQKYIDLSEKWDDLPKGLQADLDETRDHIKELKGEPEQV